MCANSFFSLFILVIGLCCGKLFAQENTTHPKTLPNKIKSYFSIVSNNEKDHLNDSLNKLNTSKLSALVTIENAKKPISVYTIQNLNFGTFTATSGSQIILSPQGSLNHIGKVQLIGYEHHPAVYEIIADTQKTLYLQIELENTQPSNSLKTKLELISDKQGSYFEVYPPPQKNYINIGGKLTVIEGNTTIAGNLDARFNILLTIVNE